MPERASREYKKSFLLCTILLNRINLLICLDLRTKTGNEETVCKQTKYKLNFS